MGAHGMHMVYAGCRGINNLQATTEEHARAVVDKIGWDKRTYGTMAHHIEYNMRFVYVPFGIFDKYVQWCNNNRSEKMIQMYEEKNKMM